MKKLVLLSTLFVSSISADATERKINHIFQVIETMCDQKTAQKERLKFEQYRADDKQEVYHSDFFVSQNSIYIGLNDWYAPKQYLFNLFIIKIKIV